ncbi:hypothetical protein ANCCAN_24865 [Ancylostoma caninum]|uniref:Uncharacterized protein n=1 Tax=Ancylostoma caninum TaxID=29170 RepID=A0A368FB53_ANCCA|nr:hypothetical protein ANCCAN_24865 [Ancylostoma caninum]
MREILISAKVSHFVRIKFEVSIQACFPCYVRPPVLRFRVMQSRENSGASSEYVDGYKPARLVNAHEDPLHGHNMRFSTLLDSLFKDITPLFSLFSLSVILWCDCLNL